MNYYLLNVLKNKVEKTQEPYYINAYSGFATSTNNCIFEIMFYMFVVWFNFML